MDIQQEEINDFVDGDVNEQVEEEVNYRFTKISRGKSYTNEEARELKKKLRQEVRQEILDDMQFKRRYQEERHLNDLEEQKRNYDMKRYEYITSHMADRWWNERKNMDSEGQIYTDDINFIDPNMIVSRICSNS